MYKDPNHLTLDAFCRLANRRARGSFRTIIVLAVLLADAPAELPAQESVNKPPAQSGTNKREADLQDQSKVPDGINKEFLSPELNPEEWLKRFEIESREVFAGRESILKAIGIKPGQSIADVGSGIGLYLGPFSKAVGGGGHVFAVDISPRLIEHIQQRVRAEKMENVTVIASTDKSTMLAPGSVDFVFVCDTYHHFEQHAAMRRSILNALRPGGQLIVIDFHRIPGKSRDWLLTHVRAGRETVRDELTSSGFEFVEEVTLPEFQENYLLRFRKPVQVDSPPKSP